MKAAAWGLGAQRAMAESDAFPALPSVIERLLDEAVPPISEESLDEMAARLAAEFRKFGFNLSATAAQLPRLKHWPQRAMIARALAMWPSHSNAETRVFRAFIARQLLGDPDPAVRYDAATALVHTSSAEALPALRERLAGEKESTVRAHLEELVEDLT